MNIFSVGDAVIYIPYHIRVKFQFNESNPSGMELPAEMWKHPDCEHGKVKSIAAPDACFIDFDSRYVARASNSDLWHVAKRTFG